METAALLRSFYGALRPIHQSQSFLEKPAACSITSAASKSALYPQVSVAGQSIISTTVNRRGPLLPYVKASETTSTLVSDAVDSDKSTQEPSEKTSSRKSTFPNGFEALILEVCDETEVAELQLKVGDFEMHMKRSIGIPKAPTATAPPMMSPVEAMLVPNVPAAQPAVPQKSAAGAASQFANISSAMASKLATLEASGSNSYILISSPTVGSFREGGTLKGKKQPPSCKEGDTIKEGQVIGYVDQFGNELPVKSEVAGEILKVLFKDGEAVGYGDPLIAVLPSFHGIK